MAQLDPISGDFRSTAGLAGRLFSERHVWRVGLEVSADTATTPEPVTPDSLETNGAVAAFVARRLGLQVSVDWGVRAGARASHWSAPELAVREPFLLAFVGINLEQPVVTGAPGVVR